METCLNIAISLFCIFSCARSYVKLSGKDEKSLQRQKRSVERFKNLGVNISIEDHRLVMRMGIGAGLFLLLITLLNIYYP